MLKNYTPHDLVFIFDAGGTIAPAETAVYPSEGVARAAVTEEPYGYCPLDHEDGGELTVPVVRTTYTDLTGLPEPRFGVLYVVSMIAYSAARAAGRDDVAVPHDLVRDDAGRVVGCRALARPGKVGVK